ncbi:hypothetical protein ACE1TH_07915 [Shouchella sp. JSM 1781072]|uniref:hypothetical protein n=1 Tax=Bacillaceae TaxID=186817 RepID=UPI000C077456|nr:hypothetical protein [Bacillus sp. Marseille-P3800]
MKRLVYLAIAIIVILGIQNDLTGSTLSNLVQQDDNTSEAQTNQTEEDPPPIPSQEVIIESGQTVLSIVERLHNGQVDQSIQEILADFSVLNDGINPNEIQIGQTYRFPLYTKQ